MKAPVRYWLVALALTLLLGCGERVVTPFRMQEVVAPTGGDVLAVAVAGNGRLVSLTESHLYTWDEPNHAWTGQRAALERDLGLPNVPFRSVLLDGLQHNYPRSRLFTSWNGAVWVLARRFAEPMLLYSDTAGVKWRRIELPSAPTPPTEDDEEGEPTVPAEDVPPPSDSVRATEPYRLIGDTNGLFVVGTQDIWRFEGTIDEPKWASIGTDGLPRDATGLPPAIRNYLPASEARPFEVVTVLAEQLMVFRRGAPDEPWVMVSTLTTVDRELVGVPNGDTVFLVAPDSLQRSDDQGERWFRFWPEGQARPESTLIVPRDEVDAGYILLAGASDGSIWRSLDGGGSWDQSRAGDPDGRAISGLTARGDEIWASSLGLGVMRSTDDGATWQSRNLGLRAAQPLDVALTERADILLASRAGLHRLAGSPESGSWTTVHERATSAVYVEPSSNRTVAGTTSGDITTQSEEAEPVQIPNPFPRKAAIEFVPPSLSRAAVPPSAVVSVASRDEGQRWLAWSRFTGAAQSDDGGLAWRPLDVSDALVGALSSTTVTQLVVDSADTIFLVEESPDSRSPALLWRSTNNGESWTTVHAFERDGLARVIVKTRPPNFPGMLYSAQGGAFRRSTNAGETWEIINGPWANHRIVDFSIRDQRAALLVDTRRQFEVVTFADLDAANPRVDRHIMVFPAGNRPEYSDITGFEVQDRRVVVTSRDRLWTGTLPSRRGALPDGMAMLATLAGALVLIAAAYLFLRGSLRDG